MATSTKSQTLELAKEHEVIKVIDDGQALATSGEVDARHARAICMFVSTNSGAVSGGTVKLESAPEENYAGEWMEIGSITVSIGGPKLQAVTAYEDEDGLPARVVRARISGAIANGSVDVFLVKQH